MRAGAQPLTGGFEDYNPLMDLVGDAGFVLLGAASHGTHEFYRERAQITKRLIEEKGFSAVAIEANWPHSYRVNRYVRSQGNDNDAIDALDDFRRFPAWMWRNADVVQFVEWLRGHNEAAEAGRVKVGFYGVDLYSLAASSAAVVEYLDRIDPRAADRTRAAYASLSELGDHARGYGVVGPLAKRNEDDAVRGLVELQESRAVREARRAGPDAEDEFFDAMQNARIVKNADAYYRSMYRSELPTWNRRERHMAESLEELFAHLNRRQGRAKIAVWAHNSHLGDARATEQGQDREINIGQIVRERHGREAVLVGFATHHGTVTAASDWDTAAELKEVRPALPESYEALFHATQLGRLMLISRHRDHVPEPLRHLRPERAIGVLYHSETPELERASHYLNSRLAKQFDAIIHFDQTRAVEFLERNGVNEGEVPETYPFEV